MRYDELYHFGVLGMKWGVRRYQPYSVRGRKGGKTGKETGQAAKSSKSKRSGRDEADYRKKENMRKAVKNRRLLDEKELDRRIRRLEKEKKLRELTDAEINPGRKITKDLYNDYGKRTVQTFATAAGVAAGIYALKKLGVPTESISKYVKLPGLKKR